MKHYTYIIYNKAAVAITLLLLLLFASCSKESSDIPDIPDEPKLCTVTISLQAPNSMRPVTKASGEEVSTDWADEKEESEYERNISDWIVVAYDKSGKSAGYLRSNSYNEGNEDSETTREMQLPEGTYNFYAFANLSSLEDGSNIITEITKESSVESYIKDLSVNIGNLSNKFNIPEPAEKKLIPMSSYAQEYTISHDDIVEIPLIRMIGKVKVTIKNGLGEAIKVSNLKLKKFRRDGLIQFLPWGNEKYLEFDKITPNINQGPPFDEDTYDKTPYIYQLIGEESVDIAGDDKEHLYSCYVEETLFTKLNSTKGLLVSLDIEGRNTIDRETSFDFVRRNDLLEIPLLVTKLDGKITIGDMKLPIGVYPKDYVFGEEGDIQILTPITHHLQSAGDLVIKYELTEPITNKTWKIKYRPEGNVVETEKYSNYTLIPAQSGGSLLIDRETNAVLTASKTIYKFDSPADGSGSFVIRTQELANTASATIKLTLIVEYGTGTNNDYKKEGEIEIPYTINITNAPESTDSGTTTKGGNV